MAHDLRSVPQYAAYANAAFGHSCELDDGHLLSDHPGVIAVPTAIAVGEHMRRSGREVLTAIVAGGQVMAIVLGPIHRQTNRAGWHGVKIVGAIGAAASAGLLYGLGTGELAHALGIAASSASGTMEYATGGEVKRFHPAMAVRDGIEAALLARAGVTAPRLAIEGDRGLYRLFAPGAPHDVDAGLWTRDHILDTITKPYPCMPIPPVAALAQILDDHEVEVSEIRRVHVRIPPEHMMKWCSVRAPVSMISAQSSLAYSVALRAVKRSNALHYYTDARAWNDPETLAFVRLVEVAPLPGAEAGDTIDLRADVSVELRDGRRLRSSPVMFKGHPDNPFDFGEMETRFITHTRDVIGEARARQVISAVAGIDEAANLDLLTSLVRSPGS